MPMTQTKEEGKEFYTCKATIEITLATYATSTGEALSKLSEKQCFIIDEKEPKILTETLRTPTKKQFYPPVTKGQGNSS